jgi:hypothetical protein
MSMRSRKKEEREQHAAPGSEALRDETNAITTEIGYIKKSLW